MQLSHTKKITVSPEHLDRLNHVNNVQYVHWMEEMAQEHWDILKDKTIYAEDYWVLMDHHIQYKKQVFLGDTVTIKTYPEDPEGLKQPRKVEFFVNDDLAVDSRTLWVLFDGKTHKIKRIDGDWLEKLKQI